MRPFIQFVLAMALVPLAATTAAQAQQEDPTVYVTSYIEVAPAAQSQAGTALKQLADASRKDAGVLNFEVAQRILPPNQFVVLEVWKDQQSFDAHQAAAHTKQSTTALTSLLIAPTDTRVLTQMVAQAFQAPPGKQHVFLVER